MVIDSLKSPLVTTIVPPPSLKIQSSSSPKIVRSKTLTLKDQRPRRKKSSKDARVKLTAVRSDTEGSPAKSTSLATIQ